MYDPSGISVTMAAQSGGWGGKTGLYFVDLCNGNPKLTSHARCIKAKYNSGSPTGAATIPACSTAAAQSLPRTGRKKAEWAADQGVRRTGLHPYNARTATALSFRTAKNAPTVCMRIREATKQGYAVARCGDSINLAFPTAKQGVGVSGRTAPVRWKPPVTRGRRLRGAA